MATVKWLPGNGPKLAASATALGIAGADDNAKATALRTAVSGYSSLQMNEFLENFTNKILVSSMYKHLNFTDPYSKAFMKVGTSVVDAKEIFASKLLSKHTFDKDKRFPDAQTRAKNLNHVIRTVLREYFTNTVSLAGVKAAFASEQAYGEWFTEQTQLLTESMQVRLFDFLQEQIIAAIKNEITVEVSDLTAWDEILVKANGIASNMAVPSVKYNLGFADPSDAANADEVRKQIMTRDRLYFMSNTDVINYIDGLVGPVKFHNEYFDIKKYKGTLMSDQLSDTEIILIADNAAQGHYRVNEVASNTWAGNLTLETFLHFWIVFGLIPWAVAVKLNITKKA